MGVAHLAHGDSGGSLPATVSVVVMWFAMMSVMMAPVAWPWIATFGRLNLHASRASALAATLAFIGGYGGAWLLYSIAAAIVQILLTTEAGLNASQGLPSGLAALLLIGAGLIQFSSLKRACLRHCRNPFTYLLARWQHGPMPAWRIGFSHGLLCVGCCWALMATMLVVGVMNLWWMVAITLATFLEQVTRRGEFARKAIGVGLIAAGCVQAAVALALIT